MHITNVKVPREWTKLSALIHSGRTKFEFELDKNYYIHNISEYVLCLAQSDEFPTDSTEVSKLYSGKSAGYVKSEGKDLYVRNNLPDIYSFPKTIAIVLSDDVTADTALPVGDYKEAPSLRGAYVFKASVESEADLPETAEVGDVYDIKATGMNVAWTGSEWDDLGQKVVEVDLTPYALKDDVNSEVTSLKEADAQLEIKIQDKADTVEVYSALDTKLNKSDLPENVSAFNNDAGYLSEHQDISGLATKEELKDYAKSEALDAYATKESLSDYAKSEALDAYATTEALDASLLLKANASDLTKLSDALDDKAETSDLVTVKSIADASDAAVTSALSRLGLVEDRLSALSKTNTEPVAAESGTALALSDTTKDYIVSGEIDQTATITGKSVTLKSATLSNNARLKVSATDGDVDVKDLTVSGSFPKASGNSVVQISDAEYVTIKDATIDATAYNLAEIGLKADTLPKGVLIDNCRFEGTLSNNAILIFGTQDDAVININNCYFQDVSNAIRLSNRTNAKNVTINITNCTCDKWDATPAYAGLLLCQDYTSKSATEVEENNLFGPDKITINISNFTGPDGKKLVAPEDLASICGTATEDQVIYLWTDVAGAVAYDSAKYPRINIM
jgi:hypothetical protein